MSIFQSINALYTYGKTQTATGVCSVLSPVTPENFASHCPRFIDGFFVTIELLLLSCLFALMIAVPLALARTSGIRILAAFSYVYIYVFRGTPLLIQLWILYYGIGSLGEERLGILWVFFLDAWSVGLLALTLNSGAYVAEILRGGIQNVDKGQVEAAKALGLAYWSRMRKIILPQAFRIAWPAYGNEVVLLMKGSALVSTITVFDLMGVTRTVFSRSYSLDIFLYATIFYLLIAVIIGWSLRSMEKRFFRYAAR
ncbi:MAG: ABC transporter permease [Methyloligellaceae bacterium]